LQFRQRMGGGHQYKGRGRAKKYASAMITTKMAINRNHSVPERGHIRFS
jgi:hypothetical protein